MQQKAQFSKSKVENLFRHRGGNYYAVAKVDGKVRRKCLETADYNQARARLDNALADLRGTVNSKHAGTLAEAITTESLRADPTIKETTRKYYQQVAVSLIKSSDSLPSKPADKKLSKATLADLRAWMDDHAASLLV